MKLDLNGKVLGASGGQGKGPTATARRITWRSTRRENIYVAGYAELECVQKLVEDQVTRDP
jgi:hypothetical protein